MSVLEVALSQEKYTINFRPGDGYNSITISQYHTMLSTIATSHSSMNQLQIKLPTVHYLYTVIFAIATVCAINNANDHGKGK